MLRRSLLLISFLSFILFSTPISAKFPKALTFHNHPIDSLCFENPEVGDYTIKLNHCGLVAEKGQIKGANNHLLKRGFIGYTFKSEWGGSEGYSYYKVMGYYKNKIIIYTVNSGGGSGEFTAIKTVTRHHNTITVNTLQSGDRCNNGINFVKVQKNRLIYEINITAFDFFLLTHNNPHQLKAYDDIEACAACCLGTAILVRELTTNKPKERLESVDFSHYQPIKNAFQEERQPQRCFDRLIHQYQERGKLSFNEHELEAWVNQFNQECIK